MVFAHLQQKTILTGLLFPAKLPSFGE